MRLKTPVEEYDADGCPVILCADGTEPEPHEWLEIVEAVNALHGYDGPVWEGMVAEMVEVLLRDRGNLKSMLLAKLRPAEEGEDG